MRRAPLRLRLVAILVAILVTLTAAHYWGKIWGHR